MVVLSSTGLIFFFFKQKTAYEVRISDWSSDVCSSDLGDSPIICRPRGRRSRTLVWYQRGKGRRSKQPSGLSFPVTSRGGRGRRQSHRGISQHRSEERRVGKEGVSTCRSRGSPYH